jgi:hypothetical protein
VPFGDGNVGNTLPVNTAPVAAVKLKASAVLGAEFEAVHSASQRDPEAPQSASISTVRVEFASVTL